VPAGAAVVERTGADDIGVVAGRVVGRVGVRAMVAGGRDDREAREPGGLGGGVERIVLADCSSVDSTERLTTRIG
jgi:hypothetical protein